MNNVFYKVVFIYMITSFLEWYIHRYLMHYSDNSIINAINTPFKSIYNSLHGHKQDEGHVKHHTLVKNNGVVDGGGDEDEGMYYDVTHIPFTTLTGFTIYYIITKLVNFKHTTTEYAAIFGVYIGISIIYYKLWNILHPSYHKYGDYYKSDFFRNNFVYHFLEKYHMIHHLNKGAKKCNFNIILPGFDHIMGTFKWKIDNTEFCRNKINKTDKEEGLCNNINVYNTC